MDRDSGLLDPADWPLYFPCTEAVAALIPTVSTACDCHAAGRWGAAAALLSQALRALEAQQQQQQQQQQQRQQQQQQPTAPPSALASGADTNAVAAAAAVDASASLVRAVLLTGRAALALATAAPGSILRAAEDARSAAALSRSIALAQALAGAGSGDGSSGDGSGGSGSGGGTGSGEPGSTAAAHGAALLLARALLREGLAVGCLRGATWRELARARVQEARDLARATQAELEDEALGQELAGAAGGALGGGYYQHGAGAIDAPLALACAAKALWQKAEGALAQLALGFMDGVPVEHEREALRQLGLGAGGAEGQGGEEGALAAALAAVALQPQRRGGEGEEDEGGAPAAASAAAGAAAAGAAPVYDKFEAMERWMRGGGGSSSSSSSVGGAGAGAEEGSGAEAAPAPAPRGAAASAFPLLVTRDYGGEVRGVHLRADCEAECELLAVAEAQVLTVEKARAHPACQALARAGIDRELSAAKHCYLALYLLCTRGDPASPFAPYYAVLPRSFPSVPLFWGAGECGWLAGSHLLEQVEDRRRNILNDYRLVLGAVPELGALAAGGGGSAEGAGPAPPSPEDFLWARMIVASRNFGITVDGVRTDALVPYADMLNHLRPRQTRWLYDSARRAFLIVALQPLVAGQQVFDSYGKKCNSRFLLNYGFTVEHNADDDTGQAHNELRLVLGLPPPSSDPWHWHKAERLGGGVTSRSVRISTFYDCEGTLEAFSFLRFAHASGSWHGFSPAPGLSTLEAFLGGPTVTTLGSSAGSAAAAAATAAAATAAAAASAAQRLVHPGSDLSHCPTALGEEAVDLGTRPIPPLSCANECAVLGALAALCAGALRRYPRSLAEDLEELRAVDSATGALRCAPFSNRRNALVLLAGEKAIAEHYVALAAAAAPLLRAREAREGLARAAEVVAAGEGSGGAPRAASRERDTARYVKAVVVPLLQRRAALEAAAAEAAAAGAQGKAAGRGAGGEGGGGGGEGAAAAEEQGVVM